MKFYITAEAENPPIKCPNEDCNYELTEEELRHFCNDQALLTKVEKAKFKLFLTQNNDIFNHCPTPDCKFTFMFESEKENEYFT